MTARERSRKWAAKQRQTPEGRAHFAKLSKEYRERNRERVSKLRRKWRAKNREKLSKAYSEWDKANREKRNAYLREQRALHPEKFRARDKVKYALRKGTVQRKPCAKCECEKTQAHHPDYSRPLDVVWLCAGCHALEHVA